MHKITIPTKIYVTLFKFYPCCVTYGYIYPLYIKFVLCIDIDILVTRIYTGLDINYSYAKDQSK